MHQFKRTQRVRILRGRLCREVYAVTRYTAKPYAVFREWLDGRRESRNLYYRTVAGWLFAAPGDEDSWGSYEVERWSDFAPKDDFCWDGPTEDDVALLKSCRPAFRWCLDKAKGYSVAELFQLLRAFDEDPAVEHLVEAGLKSLALSDGFRSLTEGTRKAVVKWSLANGDHPLRTALDCIREGITVDEQRGWRTGSARYHAYKVHKWFKEHKVHFLEYEEYLDTLRRAGKDSQDPYWGIPSDFRARRRAAERIVANLRKAETAAREKVLEGIAGRYLGGIYEKLHVYVPGSYAAFKAQAKALDQCLITNDYPTRVANGVCVLVFIERAGKPLATAELIPSGKGWRVGQFYGDERKKDYLAGPAERSALKAWAKANKLKLAA